MSWLTIGKLLAPAVLGATLGWWFTNNSWQKDWTSRDLADAQTELKHKAAIETARQEAVDEQRALADERVASVERIAAESARLPDAVIRVCRQRLPAPVAAEGSAAGVPSGAGDVADGGNGTTVEAVSVRPFRDYAVRFADINAQLRQCMASCPSWQP